jgi:transcription elongation factor Elf1
LSDIPKLKPCPFCGGEAEYCIIKVLSKGSIRCSKCKTEVRTNKTGLFSTAEEAAIVWNTRSGF